MIMDLLSDHLNKKIANPKLHVAVRAATKRGRTTIDKCYSKTDELIMHRLGMMPHSHYMTKYFMKASWEDSRFTTANDI